MTKIVIVTKNGRIIKFNSDEVPTQKRKGMGIIAILIQEGDEVVSAFSVEE